MKIIIDVFKKNTRITFEGRPYEIKRIAPELSFFVKKERDNQNELKRIDSLFKNYQDEVPF